MSKPETVATLNPEALKLYRKRAGLSQQGLADKSKISKTTINRWECGKQTKNIHPSSRDRLCDALCARWDELTRAPEPADRALLLNRVPLKGDIAGSARTALTFVQLAYGLREEAIIDLAPLAFLILAERSLQARKAALDETVAALEAATADACERLPYLRGAFRDGYDYDWIDTERESLKERVVFEEYVVEGEPMSPFVDFIRKEIETLGLFKEASMELHSEYRNAPDYAIPVEYLGEGLELDGTNEADRHTLQRIQEGRIDLREAYEKREAKDYRDWLAEKCRAIDDEMKNRISRAIRGFKIKIKIRPSQIDAGRNDTPDPDAPLDNTDSEHRS